ncbi:NADH dehydrogenase [ubiquinone] 1 alpha subcomplex subunit 2-like isoform X2 [Myxocyprinus asiaticus]|uniref:NADH dehydrogenase [ubiquinone] 1 alpha subcomplex subunit 2-like isoform X2 n=1 Tax=Myxocyprinus asiaticus TaxID=70543 RepID=UPI0022223830|nr:NADH dehydrogenase [ubiquinone] 1 alpha subcomplex subunit 2-like isoform X2 [Myxocyprinus asiaticus]
MTATPRCSSKNVRIQDRLKSDFIEQHYVTLKKANPEFPILIRECSGVQPKLWARYGFGKEHSISLENMNVEQVAKALESVVNAKS